MTETEAGEKASAPRLGHLAAAIGATKTRGAAAVDTWNPPYCGEIAIRIAANGTWFYEGTPIKRHALVALFASILRKDANRYVLVTPVECLGIEVEDVPFVAVAMANDGGILRFATNLGDEVEAGPTHGLSFTIAAHGGVTPYVHVRGGLWARLTRTLAIELLDEAVTETKDGIATIGVRSNGVFFAVGTAESLS